MLQKKIDDTGIMGGIMNIFGWLFGKKKSGDVAESKKNATKNYSGLSSFYVPDTRTPEEHDALKKKYLHPDAEAVAHGVCSVGQADNEKSIAQFSTIINGVTYTASLDNLCCSKCWPLDGRVFPVEAECRPPVPRHEGCRCLYLMKTKTWEDFGIDIDDLPPVDRPWILADYQYTYKKDPTKKLKKPRRTIRKAGRFNGCAEEWIRSLPEKEQRQFFATDFAYSLWADGKIQGIDLLEEKTWGLRSDEDLKRLFCGK